MLRTGFSSIADNYHMLEGNEWIYTVGKKKKTCACQMVVIRPIAEARRKFSLAGKDLKLFTFSNALIWCCLSAAPYPCCSIYTPVRVCHNAAPIITLRVYQTIVIMFDQYVWTDFVWLLYFSFVFFLLKTVIEVTRYNTHFKKGAQSDKECDWIDAYALWCTMRNTVIPKCGYCLRYCTSR